MRILPARTRSTVSEPIKGKDHRGFVIGWLSIVAVGAAMFTIVTLPLTYTHDDARLAVQQTGMPELHAPNTQI